MLTGTTTATATPDVLAKSAKRAFKRIGLLAVAFILFPKMLAFYVVCGAVDVMRNADRSIASLERYFAGNGFCTWLLSPLNLLVDLLSLPYRNRGVYGITDLPGPWQDEIHTVIAAAHQRHLVEALHSRLDGQKRGMFFFKWYGRNIETSVDVAEFHRAYRYVRTIGVSIFNKRQSTGKHFGPLRLTLRVLYNMTPIDSSGVYIQVGDCTHYWRDNPLFIFDDTLQHQSCNESDAVRYCLFIDILRPTLVPRLLSGSLSVVGLLVGRFNRAFYRKWTFLR